MIMSEFYVNRIYDDETYEIAELISNKVRRMTKTKLKEFLKTHNVHGATLSVDNKLYCKCSFTPISAYDEDEAYDEKHEWENENDSQDGFCLEVNSEWYFFEPSYEKIHVAYYVARLEMGTYHYYVSKYAKQPATPYLVSAKEYTKETAYAVATKLTKSKKNTYSWFVESSLDLEGKN